MKTISARQPSPLAQAILGQVERYGLTVADAVLRLPELEGREHRDAERLLRHLEATGRLTSTWLHAGRRCYYAPQRTKANAHTLDTAAFPKPDRLSEETKIRRFAMLSFCCLGNVSRIRLTPGEMEQYFEQPHELGLAHSYYLQPGPPVALGFLRVDMGGPGRWDRILAKCWEDACRHARSTSFQPHVAAGRFEITLATAMPQKADRLLRAFRESSSPPGVPIRILSIPQLLPLVAPPPE